ncbi:hypothetical protein JW877_07335 [bacterium]|nr:hypothetical protein [bacterium]
MISGTFFRSLDFIIPVSIVVIVLLVIIIWKGIVGHRVRVSTGMEGIIGEFGHADGKIEGTGHVILHGERWRARSKELISAGAEVEVVGIDRNMVVEVKKV